MKKIISLFIFAVVVAGIIAIAVPVSYKRKLFSGNCFTTEAIILHKDVFEKCNINKLCNRKGEFKQKAKDMGDNNLKVSQTYYLVYSLKSDVKFKKKDEVVVSLTAKDDTKVEQPTVYKTNLKKRKYFITAIKFVVGEYKVNLHTDAYVTAAKTDFDIHTDWSGYNTKYAGFDYMHGVDVKYVRDYNTITMTTNLEIPAEKEGYKGDYHLEITCDQIDRVGYKLDAASTANCKEETEDGRYKITFTFSMPAEGVKNAHTVLLFNPVEACTIDVQVRLYGESPNDVWQFSRGRETLTINQIYG